MLVRLKLTAVFHLNIDCKIYSKWPKHNCKIFISGYSIIAVLFFRFRSILIIYLTCRLWVDRSRARSIQPKFQPVRPWKVVHLKRWTRFFETFPVGPNRSIEFWTEISGNFGWMDRALHFPSPITFRVQSSKHIPRQGQIIPQIAGQSVTILVNLQ